MSVLTGSELERYSRQIILDQIGVQGQQRIKEGRVLVVGAGGLGSPVSLYLAAAGVGHIRIVDPDLVDLSNLQRQVIHTSADLGRPKVVSAKEKMLAINPGISVESVQIAVSNDNIESLISDCDFVLDCTDSQEAKYLVNDACVLNSKSFSVGGIARFNGQLITHVPGSACYRCVFPHPQTIYSSNSRLGVLGATAGILGSIEAAEAVKFLIGNGNLLVNRLLVFDALTMQFNSFSVKRDSDCQAWGNPL